MSIEYPLSLLTVLISITILDEIIMRKVNNSSRTVGHRLSFPQPLIVTINDLYFLHIISEKRLLSSIVFQGARPRTIRPLIILFSITVLVAEVHLAEIQYRLTVVFLLSATSQRCDVTKDTYCHSTSALVSRNILPAHIFARVSRLFPLILVLLSFFSMNLSAKQMQVGHFRITYL